MTAVTEGRGFVRPDFQQKIGKSLGNIDKLREMTKSTDPADYSIAGRNNNSGVQKLPIGNLVPFPNHPFKLYTGERKNDMIESIRSSGVLNPIIVRECSGQYQILSGHNRCACAKEAGLYDVPVIVMNNLTDDDAMLIVTETNLYQRSFADLSHSERARALALHIEANKHQGKRNDLIFEIENMLKAGDDAGLGTFCQIGEKLNVTNETAQKYELSPRQVSRYLRIDKLTEKIKERVDSEEIGLIAGVAISYISDDEQNMLDRLIEENAYKVDIKKAELMRAVSKDKKLTEDNMKSILDGSYGRKPAKAKKRTSVTVKPAVINKYFGPYESEKDVVNIIDQSLEIYMENKKYFNGCTADEIKEKINKALESYFGDDSVDPTEDMQI